MTEDASELRNALAAVNEATRRIHLAVEAGEIGEARAADPLLALTDAVRVLREYIQ